MSLCQGGNFFSGMVSGALGSFGASAWGAMVGDKIAKSAVGTIAFGALSGGVGAELTDGNFWQGVLIGGMVAGLNHTMHRAMDDGEGPKPKTKKIMPVKSKSASMVSKLHKMFDTLEEIGAWTEVAGVAAAPFTEGISLAAEPIGFWEGSIGTAGNVGVDMFEFASTQDTKYLKTAAFRTTKFIITAGLGKAIDRVPGQSYMIDKTVLKINAFLYDKIVSPGIQSRLKL